MSLGQVKLAIVVMGYNRYAPLKNLLDSLVKLKDCCNVPLIISIDAGGTPQVNKLVNDFQWQYGEKKVIIHKKRLGLKSHFFWVGDLTAIYDNIFFLEDDLLVSPYAVSITQQLITRYQKNDAIAAGSLYSPMYCEFNKTKFYVLPDNYDVFFFAHPYWGTIWMKDAWNQFRQWFETYKYQEQLLPISVTKWHTKSSFKKVFLQYLSETKRTCVFSKTSYVTNMGVPGENTNNDSHYSQTVLANGPCNLRMPDLNDSISRYDVFMEIDPSVLKSANMQLRNYDFEVDLKQVKARYYKPYVLTTRKVKKTIMEFTDQMKPLENAAIFGIEGSGIRLARVEDVLIEDQSVELTKNDIISNYPLEPSVCLALAQFGVAQFVKRRLQRHKR